MGCACLWQVPCSRLVCSIPVWENVDSLPLFILYLCRYLVFFKEESWMESLDGSSACSGGTVFFMYH